MPKVSVLLSVYNSEAYIEDAVKSILEQSFGDFEFLIYDDCSTDRTGEIIKSFSDPRIVYIRNEKNQGLVANLIAGVERAKGEYIARMDGDDISYPERLGKQVEFLDRHKDVTIVGSSVMYFTTEGGDAGVAWQPTDNDEIKAKLFMSFTLLHPSIMVRKEDLVRNGLQYQLEYKSSEDHRLYFDCMVKGLNFANIHEPLHKMRSHADSVTRSKPKLTRTCANWAREAFLTQLGIIDEFSQEELNAWHTVASHIMPTEKMVVHAFDSFIGKIVANKKVAQVLNIDALRKFAANHLKELAYFAADKKELQKATLASVNTRIVRYADVWPLKMKLKFVAKLIKGRIKR